MPYTLPSHSSRLEHDERELYRVVDREAGGREPLTASMRHEHAIIPHGSAERAVEAVLPAAAGPGRIL